MYGGRNAETLISRTQTHGSKFSQTSLYIEQPTASPIYRKLTGVLALCKRVSPKGR